MSKDSRIAEEASASAKEEAEQETIRNYRERIRQAKRSGEFALSEALRDIIVQEQDHEIDLKDALGLR